MLLSALSILLILVPQAAEEGARPSDCLLPAELRKLETEPRLDSRVKIYETASDRCLASARQALALPNPPPVSSILNGWMQLLERSLGDIEKHSDRKKKSKALIRFEIQLRKSIAELKDSRMKVNYEEMQEIDSWTDKAD